MVSGGTHGVTLGSSQVMTFSQSLGRPRLPLSSWPPERISQNVIFVYDSTQKFISEHVIKKKIYCRVNKIYIKGLAERFKYLLLVGFLALRRADGFGHAGQLELRPE